MQEREATLLVAKLDRLARNVHFLSGLMESGVRFVAVDMPDINRLTVHVLAAVAEHEREMTSVRTRDALAAARARGIKLGVAGPRNLRNVNDLRHAYARKACRDASLRSRWDEVKRADSAGHGKRVEQLGREGSQGRHVAPGNRATSAESLGVADGAQSDTAAVVCSSRARRPHRAPNGTCQRRERRQELSLVPRRDLAPLAATQNKEAKRGADIWSRRCRLLLAPAAPTLLVLICRFGRSHKLGDFLCHPPPHPSQRCRAQGRASGVDRRRPAR